MKLWGGRFAKDTDELVNELNASIGFDQRLYAQDIQGSMAHAAMLADCGIISPEDGAAIHAGLTGILADIQAGKVEFSADNEDIHMNIEALLTARIGDAGKRLHTARSRNDQVALDFRMYVRRETDTVIGQLLELEKVLCRRAREYQTAVMPGYTHLQRAQPISFAQHLLAYAAMFRRDVTRLEDCAARLNECPLGCGALAGTTYPVDRWQTARALDFARPVGNSLDGVSDRDYALELLSDLSILMMHLSRFAEEIILWCSWEFKFIELDDAYATGSSIMPQKKNPDVAELVRGKTGRVYGSLMGLLTVMKGLPLAYNKDMQEDKEPVFDALDTVEMCLPVFSAMLETMTVLPENMRRAAGRGFINATDCADYLTKKGMPFRDAYTVTGKLVAACSAQGKTLEELSLEELKAVSPLFEADVYEALKLENCMALRSSWGGPAVRETARQIQETEAFIAQREGDAPEQSELFRSVLEQDRTAVVLCGLDHTILYMNPAAKERYAKRGGEALTGTSLLDCHSPESNEKIEQVVAWFAESPTHNRVYTYHNEKENKDVYMVALRDGAGTLIGYYEKHEYRDRETMTRYDFEP